MTLFIYLLGQPRLALDTHPLRFAAPPKTLPLLAYLLLHGRQPVDRQRVAFTLWPDDPEAAARANLRRHLHQLQRVLPPAPADRPWLLNPASALGWNPQADFWLDVDEFERLSRQPASLEESLACYAGELLEGVYDDWVFFDRERLQNRYLDALLHLILHHRTQRNYSRALELARKLLAQDPFREDVVRQVIGIRYELGDGAGGMQEYQNFEHLLHREMGTAPMPETRALYEMVRRNASLPGPNASQPARHAPPPKPCPPTLAPGQLPFVGRSAELERALAWWSRAARGRGGLALISGEAGIGKTRLAHELARMVKDQGGRVLQGAGNPVGPQPYQPVVAALESALPLLTALRIPPLTLAALPPLLPELGRRRPLPALPALDPAQERIRLFDAVARCLEGLAEARPLLLLLEDLHTVEPSTVALLEFLAHRAAETGLLILGTYREEETPPAHPLRALRRRLAEGNRVEHLALGPLPPPAIADLLNRLEAAHLLPTPPDTGLAARLSIQSEGHPLLAELLLQHWQEGREIGTDRLPDGVHTAITRRLERLSEGARSYADAAAVAGPAFDTEVVREVGGWSECQAFEYLGELLERRLIREAESRGRFDYRFAHHLIQAVLYAEIPPARRRRRHRRIARVLEALSPSQCDEWIETLAVHYDRGDAAAQAIPCYWTAAHHHLQVYADSEALAALDRALQLAAEVPPSAPLRTRIELLLLRESIHHRRGDRAAQLADLQQLEPLAADLSDPDLTCELLRRRILYCRAVDDRPAQWESISALHQQARISGNARWLAEALMAEGSYHALVSAYPQARTVLETALHYYEQDHDPARQTACYCALADIAVQQGDFPAAQASLAQAAQLAEGQSNRSLVVAALRAASGALFARQDFDTAEALAVQMLNLCREIGDREGEADALARLAAVAARLFRVQEARQHYRAAGQLYQALGKRQGQAAVMVNTCMLVVGRLGRYAEGLVLARSAETIFRELQDLRGQAVCALNEGMITLYLEDYETSCRAAQRGLELAQQIGSRMMEANALSNLGAAERELGRLDAAVAHMEAGLAIRRALGQPAELGTDLCDLTVAYCRQGNVQAARRSADEMLDLYAQSESSMMHPQYVLWAAAQARRTGGDPAQAHELLEQAVTAFHTRTEALPDSESRSTYATLPFNRQIVAAWERGEWP